MRGAALALVIAALASPAFARTSPGLKVFKDWRVGCDETSACVAIGFPTTDKRFATAALRLTIAPGPDGAITLDARIGEDDVASPVLDLPPGENPAARLIAAARQSASVRVTAPRSKPYGDISLAGLSAALLYIDERQGRIGTQAALIRKGEKPASAVPGPRQVFHVAARPFASTAEAPTPGALVAALRRTDRECEGAHGKTRTGRQWRLDGRRSLIELECTLGAYNMRSAWWIDDGKTQRRVSFFDPGEGALKELVNPSIDPARGTIETWSAGRGLGDCGTQARYVWTGQKFELAFYAMMDECAGLPPEWWPILVRGAAGRPGLPRRED